MKKHYIVVTVMITFCVGPVKALSQPDTGQCSGIWEPLVQVSRSLDGKEKRQADVGDFMGEEVLAGFGGRDEGKDDGYGSP